MPFSPAVANLTFQKFERIIQVDLLKGATEQTTVSVQDLINQIRDYEDELSFMDYGHIANAFGKQTLTTDPDTGDPTTWVGITLELINNWRLSFEARPSPPEVVCTVSGGNLVADNDYSNNPINPTENVQVVIAQSTSPSIIQAPSDTHLLYLIESLRGTPSTIGNVFYWNPDPTVGDDSNNGTTPSTPVLTFAKAKTLAAAGNNDIIFALSTDSSGITTTDEVIDIDVPTLKLRGPGYSFQFVPDEPGGATTVTISANSVEFSGFYITTAAGGTDNGIAVTGNNALIKDVWVKSATENGISISSSSRSTIDTCAIEDSSGNGINIGASTSLSAIKKCIISGSTVDGVDLSGASITDNIFENNLIYNNAGNGIDIASTVSRTTIRFHHTFAQNTGEDINDGSTTTIYDTSGAVTPGDITNIVDGVWDEVITTGHAVTGSAAKVLKDTKTRATLASLK